MNFFFNKVKAGCCRDTGTKNIIKSKFQQSHWVYQGQVAYLWWCLQQGCKNIGRDATLNCLLLVVSSHSHPLTHTECWPHEAADRTSCVSDPAAPGRSHQIRVCWKQIKPQRTVRHCSLQRGRQGPEGPLAAPSHTGRGRESNLWLQSCSLIWYTGQKDHINPSHA